MAKNIKSVRLSDDMIAYINTQSGVTFSDRLVGIVQRVRQLEAYKDSADYGAVDTLAGDLDRLGDTLAGDVDALVGALQTYGDVLDRIRRDLCDM